MAIAPESLLSIPPTGVPCRVTRKKSKDEQQHEKGNNSVNDKFKGYHD